MTPTQLPLFRVLLIVTADMLSMAGGLVMYLRTDSVRWLAAGVLASVGITLLFLVPILRAAAEAAKAPPAQKGGELVE